MHLRWLRPQKLVRKTLTYAIAIDIETTGFGKNDRIIEFGAIVFDTETREIAGQLETLINPMRNIPEDSGKIHGLKSSDLSLAPTFEEIADDLFQFLGTGKIIAHNADFDLKFLIQEFARVGKSVQFDNFTCTYKLTGQRLNVACEQISFEFEHHSAIADAQAALAIWYDHEIEKGAPLSFSSQLMLEQTFRTLTRSQVGLQPVDRRKSALSNLPVKFEQTGLENTFLGLLDAYLRDHEINDVEEFGLRSFAIDYGISEQRVIELQEIYLDSIENAALRDGIITEAEATFFNRISIALGFDRQLNPTESGSELPPAGSLVCVTGTATVNGVNYDKKTMAELLEKHGLIFTDAISKKSGVALLLQDSAGSQSSKVAKAQSWGIPRMVIADFVKMVSN
jgi:DNA polymerase III epsilon subunit family exonuclease